MRKARAVPAPLPTPSIRQPRPLSELLPAARKRYGKRFDPDEIDLRQLGSLCQVVMYSGGKRKPRGALRLGTDGVVVVAEADRWSKLF